MPLCDLGADVLIEGMRPRVMERLGLWPDASNPRLIYGRMMGRELPGPPELVFKSPMPTMLSLQRHCE